MSEETPTPPAPRKPRARGPGGTFVKKTVGAAPAAEPTAHHMTRPQTPLAPAAVAETAVAVEPGSKVTADPQLAGTFSNDEARSLAAEVDRIRKMRKPFGAMGQKLALPERWGYKSHWFNDSPGRIASANAAGWSHIKDPSKKTGEPLSIVVGSARNGQPQLGFAMEIPQEIYDEDLAERNKASVAALAAVKSKPFRARAGTAKPSDKGKFYSPAEEEGRDVLAVQKPGAVI